MPGTSPVIGVAAVRALLAADSDTLLVDVRTPAEFAGARIDGAVNLPSGELDRHLDRLTADPGRRLVLVCRSGDRATRCRDALARAGHTGTLVLDGGMAAWVAAGAPVVGAPSRWSLERQVRLVAGGLVLTSVVTGVWWPPAVWGAALIGAGLVFAALSDTCGMAMLLARLPYNRPVRR